MEQITIIFLALGSYAATNIDNLALLVGWMLSGQVARAQLMAGYAIGALVILAASTLLGLSSSAIPVEWIGFLGVVPIGLGLYTLFGQIRRPEDPGTIESRGHAAVVGIATTLIANSVDTIVVFAPLLADSRVDVDYKILTTFIVVAALWYALAAAMSGQAARLQVVVRIAGWIAPFIMITVGIYILLNTATDVV